MLSTEKGKEMKVYDLIKKLLTEYPELRSSDKRLIWKVWETQGLSTTYITKQDFLDKAELPESIRRARQAVQEAHPDLKGNGNGKKEASKGTFVFRERITIFDEKNNTVRFI